MPALALGPIAFTTFEIPARISFGGRQQLHVHTLIGGQRVIDAMGADDSLVSWSGVFSGADAVSRARALDALRIAGTEVTLAWDAFLYTVVVSSLTVRFERENWIPYEISCVVSFDEAVVAVQEGISVLSSIGLDIQSATALGPLDLVMVDAALALPGAAPLGVPTRQRHGKRWPMRPSARTRHCSPQALQWQPHSMFRAPFKRPASLPKPRRRAVSFYVA